MEVPAAPHGDDQAAPAPYEDGIAAAAATATGPQEIHMVNDANIVDQLARDRFAKDPRMRITTIEKDWALELKEGVEGLPDLGDLPDFMYVQLAIIEKGNLEGAIQRAYNLQEIEEAFDIRNTAEDGMRYLNENIQVHSEFFLSFSFAPRDSCYVFITDMKGFERKKLRARPDGDNLFVASTYYIGHCACPDFESVRNGIVMLVECDGYNWATNLDIRLARLWSSVHMAYPIRSKKMKYFNSGMFINLLHSTVKQFVSKEVMDSFEVGVKIEGDHTLDHIFLVPDAETTNHKLLLNYSKALKRRYENAKYFSLPES